MIKIIGDNMPYSNISDLPKQVKGLPLKAKKIFLKAFNTAYARTRDEELAFKIAWSAVKKKYKKKGDKWVLKKAFSFTTVIAKSGFFKPTYYMDYIISTTDKDLEGQKVEPSLLEKLVNNGLIEETGDIEHLSLEGITDFKGLFKLKNYEYKDGKLIGRFIIDKTHPRYKSFLEYIKRTNASNLYVSAEFYSPKLNGNKIVDAERLGWSFTLNPVNPNCKQIGGAK